MAVSPGAPEIAAKFYQLGRYDSAALYYAMAAAEFSRNRQWDLTVDALNREADADIRAMAPTKALNPLRIARNLLTQVEFRSDELEVQNCVLLGYVYSYLDSASQAIDVLNRAVELQARDPAVSSQSKAGALYTLGIALKKKGEYTDAIERFTEARRIQESVGDTLAEANSLMMIGTVELAMNEYNSATRDLCGADSLLIHCNRTSEASKAAFSYYLGMAYYSTGLFSLALQEYEKTLAWHLAADSNENSAVSSIYVKIGDVYNAAGDWERALDYYNRALANATKIFGTINSGFGEVYQRLGDVYADKGDLKRAKKYAEMGLSIRQSTLGARHPEIAFEYENIGDICFKSGQYREALSDYRLALQTATTFALPNRVEGGGRIKSKMGHIFAVLAQPDSAVRFLSKGIEELQDTLNSNLRDLASAERWMGEFEMTNGEEHRAVYWFDRALFSLNDAVKYQPNVHSGLVSIGLAGEFVETLGKKALCLEQLKDFDGSYAVYRRAWGLIDSMRWEFSSEGSQLRLGELERPLYINAVEMCLAWPRQNRSATWVDHVCEASERGKANILNDAVAASRVSKFAGMPDKKISRLRELKSRLAFFQEQREFRLPGSKSKDSSRIQFYRDACFTTHQEIVSLADSLEQEYPAYAALRIGAANTAFSTFHNFLDQRTCVLDYVITARFVVVIALTRNWVRVGAQSKPKNFESLIESYRTAIRLMDERKGHKYGAYLSRILLAPIRNLPGTIDHLVIIPDGVLYYVPFEALAATGGRAKPLIARYNVQYVFSASLLAKGFGDAIDTLNSSASYLGFAPFSVKIPKDVHQLTAGEQDNRRKALTHRTSSPEMLQFRSELPYSAEEVLTIQQLFRARRHRADAMLGREASIAAFKSNAPKCSVLHLATHVEIDPENPAHSAILLAAKDSSADPGEAKLVSADLYGLNYAAELIVLSTCESGMGRLIGGEGLMSLTRGFFYGGARNVVVSLWKVPDRATNDFMRFFYENVTRGKKFDRALRNAKLAMLSDKRTADPRNWAAFVLITY